MHDKLKEKSKVKLECVREVLGNDLYFDLKKIKNDIMLDHSLFDYFERCRSVNSILSKYNYFLRFFERRNKFRYQVKQKLKTKNEMHRELSTCAVRKFNGYEFLKNNLTKRSS